MNPKRLLSLLLTLILCLTLAACAGTATSGTTTGKTTGAAGQTTAAGATTAASKPDKLVTYTLMGRGNSTQGDWSKMWLFAEIERLLNIKFEINQVSSEAYEEKKNLAFATNALPDVFSEGLTNNELATYGARGTVLAIDKYLDKYAPDVLAFFADMPEARTAMTFPDGHIYTLTGINTYPRELSKYRFWVNKQWATTLGVKVPTTLDEFYTYLKAIKDGDANGNGNKDDEIPLGGMYTNWNVSVPILCALGFTETRLQANAGKVIFVPAQPLYKEYLKYMNKLYIEKLLDPEYFTQNNDQRLAKLSQGLIGAFGENAHWTVMTDKAMWSQYGGIEPMTSSSNSKKIWPAMDVRLLRQFTITSAAKNPEYLVMLANWFYTEAGSIASNSGVENGKWSGGAGGYEWTTNAQGVKCFKLTVPSDYTSFNDFRQKVITPNAFPYLDSKTMPQVQWITGLDERQIALTEEIVRSAPYYSVGWSTNIKLTETEANEANLLLTDIESYISQMEAKMIIGEVALDQFDTFVKGLESRGLKRYVEINQTAYDRWAKK